MKDDVCDEIVAATGHSSAGAERVGRERVEPELLDRKSSRGRTEAGCNLSGEAEPIRFKLRSRHCSGKKPVRIENKKIVFFVIFSFC